MFAILGALIMFFVGIPFILGFFHGLLRAVAVRTFTDGEKK